MICKKCGKNFRTTPIVDGKRRNLTNRKYCFDCSPFGSHNTRKIHFDAEHKCERCGKVYGYKYNKKKSLCGSCSVILYRIGLKKKLIEKFDSKCKICGYNRCISALEFHHLDPNEKEMQISNSSKKIETLLKEVEKCILVCNRCHREIHSGIVQLEEQSAVNR